VLTNFTTQMRTFFSGCCTFREHPCPVPKPDLTGNTAIWPVGFRCARRPALAVLRPSRHREKTLTCLKIPMNPVPEPLEHGPVQTRLRGLDPTRLDPQLHLNLKVAPATSPTDNDAANCGARDPPF
jgi:hypothetical protein